MEDAVKTQFFNYEEEYNDYVPTQDIPEGDFLDDERSIGYRLGKYYVPVDMPELGKGGQARIYECYSDEDDDTYVAKIYSTEYKQIEKVKESNKQIMEIAARNIVRIYDAGETEDGEYYMVVMEKYDELRKDFLNYELHGNEKKYRTVFNRVIKDINEALKQLHVRQIYHSDIKPKNIMRKIDENGRERMVLIDFGGSVFVDDEQKRKGKASAVGGAFSLGYQAPEQLNGIVSKASERTDAYSIGITLAELVAGVYPKIRDLKSDEASEEQKAYYERNKEGRKVFGILLPVGLPNHIVRLFEGLLYYDLDEPDNLNYRWGDSKVDMWLESAMEGDYKTAATMKFGAERTTKESRKITERRSERRSEVPRRKIYVSYPSGTEQISSTEEMAELFYNKREETIDTLMNKKDWPKIFSAFGQDVVQVLVSARERMLEHPENAFNELKKVLILFAEEPLKKELKNMFEVSGKYFNSAEELGRYMYATLLAAIKADTSYNYKEILFTGNFLDMVYNGSLREQIESGVDNWKVDEKVLTELNKFYITDFEGREDRTYIEYIEKLFGIAYMLQKCACFKLDGKIYTSYQKFLDMLEQAVETDPEKAKFIWEQCYDNTGMKFDFYLWLRSVEDVIDVPICGMDGLHFVAGRKEVRGAKNE